MIQTFYSNGKLLLTGEYTVLDGAKALAIPTKYGQYLHVEKGSGSKVTWRSLDYDRSIWFEDELSFAEIDAGKQPGRYPETDTLITILHEAFKLNPAFLKGNEGFNIITELTFPREWGLGTSSTLINNIAQWCGINAYTLLKKSFGGSGYDIACAQNNLPIEYNLTDSSPIVKQVNFNPAFADKLYFIYLNKKQNSRSAITAYRSRGNNLNTLITTITHITEDVLTTTDVDVFAHVLEKHEAIMATVLGLTPVKENLFPDFNGTLKSLGAWGGDFILAVTEQNPTAYFKSKGYDTIIPYTEMALK